MIQNRTYTWITAGALVALGFFPATTALAESGSSSGSTQIRVETKADIELGDDNGSDASASTSFSTNSRGGDDTDVEGSNRGGSATSTLNRQDSEERSGQSIKNNDSDEDGAEIEVHHDGALNASTTINRPEEVGNRGQLRSFLNHIVKGDDRIVNVNVSSTTIETKYVLPAKFLWAIPLDLTTDVKIAGDGAVTVTYPWYAFLFSKKNGDDLRSQLMTAASTTVGTTTQVSLSASLQARLLNAFFGALKGSTDN